MLSQRVLFGDRIRIIFNHHALLMASIESTIAYKEQIARSGKDVLDAKHLRLVFAALDAEKIERCKSIFNQEFHQ